MMRDYDEDEYDMGDRPTVVVYRSGSGIVPLLLGVALGAGAALLWAPQSGADTRRLMKRRAREASAAAQRKADELMDTVRQSVDDVGDRVTQQFRSAQASVRRQRDDLRGAFEAGRSVAQEARIELERKLTERKLAERKAVERDGQDV